MKSDLIFAKRPQLIFCCADTLYTKTTRDDKEYLWVPCKAGNRRIADLVVVRRLRNRWDDSSGMVGKKPTCGAGRGGIIFIDDFHKKVVASHPAL
jgi:hypothetical protein